MVIQFKDIVKDIIEGKETLYAAHLLREFEVELDDTIDLYSRNYEEEFEDRYGYMPDEDDYRMTQQISDFNDYWDNR